MTTPHPFLEKASWVAGIASAIIAAVVWLKPSSTSEASDAKNPTLQAPTPSQKQPEQPAPLNVSAVAAKSNGNARWSCDGIATDLLPAFTAAKNITYTAPRDQAYFALARKALCLENYSMFDEAAKLITYTAPKDQAYGDAVDFALGIRKFDLAEKFASQITYTAPRDAARARIVAKSSEQ